jgi:hypothetical protein
LCISGVDLAARQEGHGAVEIDGEAALDLVEDDALDALAGVELGFQADPAFLTASLLARQDGLAQRILDALDIDFDLVAGLQLLGAGAEFLQRDAALDLEADIDDGHVLLDGRDQTLDDGTFGGMLGGERLVEQAGKIVTGGVCLGHMCS